MGPIILDQGLIGPGHSFTYEHNYRLNLNANCKHPCKKGVNP